MKMKNILDEEYTEREVDLSDYNFRGKLSGLSWKLEQAQARVSMARKVIFGMSILLYYPIIRNYIVFSEWDWEMFLERSLFSGILILCGVFFHKNRLVAMIVASLPITLILLAYLFFIDYLPLRTIGFFLGVLFLIGVGIYYHFQEKKIRQELVIQVRKDNPEAVKRG